MKSPIKILLLGDEGVGKSSLISSYVSRHFPEEVPPVMADANVPPDLTSNYVCVTITDSSARQGDREILKIKIKNAESVLALYDSTRLETLDSLMEEWLPLCMSIFNGQIKPVIVVGTKTDLLGEFESERQTQDEEKLRNIILKFPFVLATCSSSAKLLNVDQTIYDAVVAVTCPLHPLYDVYSSTFTAAFKRAFLHIFRVFDTDGDNLLSDYELSAMQQSTFQTTLNAEDVSKLKQYIRNNVPQGLSKDKLLVTYEGFQGLWKMFLMRSRTEYIWEVLRRVDYDDHLNLELPDNLDWNEKPQQTPAITTLSNDALAFLQNLTRNYLSMAAVAISTTAQEALDINDSNSKSNSSELLPPTLIAERDRYSELSLCSAWQSERDKMAFVAIRSMLCCLPPAFVHPWSHADASFEELEELQLPLPSAKDSFSSSYSSPTRKKDIAKNTASDTKRAAGEEAGFRHRYLMAGMAVAGSNTIGVCSVDYWMLHWHMLAMYKPSYTQQLLYRLGYVERPNDNGVASLSALRSKQRSSNNNSSNSKGKSSAAGKSTAVNNVHTFPLHKNVFKLCILGKDGVGKRSLVRSMSNLSLLVDQRKISASTPLPTSASISAATVSPQQPPAMAISSSSKSSTSSSSSSPTRQSLTSDPVLVTASLSVEEVSVEEGRPELLTGGCITSWVVAAAASNHDAAASTATADIALSSPIGVANYLVATSIPTAAMQPWLAKHGPSCDVALILVDPLDEDSFEQAKLMEDMLAPETPRIFFFSQKGHRSSFCSLLNSNNDIEAGQVETPEGKNSERIANRVKEYIAENELIAVRNIISLGLERIKSLELVVEGVLEVLHNPEKGIPLRIRTAKKPMSWLFIAGMGFGMSVGVGAMILFIAKRNEGGMKVWFNKLLNTAAQQIKESTLLSRFRFSDSLKH